MPRNRYPKLVHEEQRAQLARQEKALAALARELHRPSVTQSETLQVTDVAKEQRRIRRDRNLRHKPALPASTSSQSAEPSARTAA